MCFSTAFFGKKYSSLEESYQQIAIHSQLESVSHKSAGSQSVSQSVTIQSVTSQAVRQSVSVSRSVDTNKHAVVVVHNITAKQGGQT